jgi:hypothetical protein
MPKQINRRVRAVEPRGNEPAVVIHGPQFLSPFLLGVTAALLLVTIPTIAGFLWICGDVALQRNESHCPRLVVKQSQSPAAKQSAKQRRQRDWWNLFGLRIQEQEEEMQLVTEYLILLEDPIQTTCRNIVSAWSILTTKRHDSNFENSCSPTILDEATMDDADIASSDSDVSRDHSQFKTAYTKEYLQLTTEEKRLVMALGEHVVSQIDDWTKRASLVPWGGCDDCPSWFAPANAVGESELEQLDGGLLFYSYLRIMKWPTALFSTFPFKLCAKGCDSQVGKPFCLFKPCPSVAPNILPITIVSD